MVLCLKTWESRSLPGLRRAGKPLYVSMPTAASHLVQAAVCFLLVFSVSGIRFAADTERLFRMRFLWRGVEQPGSSSGS